MPHPPVPRSNHSATVLYWDVLELDFGWTFGNEAAQLAHIHDEIQSAVLAALAQQAGEACVYAIQKAGEVFNLRIPLDGEFKIGDTWADTH